MAFVTDRIGRSGAARWLSPEAIAGGASIGLFLTGAGVLGKGLLRQPLEAPPRPELAVVVTPAEGAWTSATAARPRGS